MPTRRAFMKGAIAYQVVGTAAQTPVPASANSQVGLGFIGIGTRGSWLLEGMRKTAGARVLVAADVFDLHLDWARETAPGIDVTRDYRAVLDRKDVDAVVIATPDHWHARMVSDALDAGKHVYVEKPLTHSVAEGPRLIEAAKKAGRMVTVGSQYKTMASTQQAREIVAAGQIGAVHMVHMSIQRNSPEGAWVYPIPTGASEKNIDWTRFLGPAPRVPFQPERFFRWRCWWEYSGGVATDLWVHMFTGLHEMLGVRGPKSVVAQGGLFRWKDGRTVPDVLCGIYDYDGFLADVYTNLTNGRGGDNRTVLMGSEGTLFVENERLMLWPELPPLPVAMYGFEGWPKAAREEYLTAAGFPPGTEVKLPPVKPERTIRIPRGPEHYALFVKSLLEGSANVESAEDGHSAAVPAHLANVAYRNGQRVKWDSTANAIRP